MSLKPGGYATVIDPGASRLVEEFDTNTCPHCGQISMLRAGLRATPQVLVFRADGTHYMRDCGFCRNCYQHVCPRCDGKPCDNRFRRLDEEEKAAVKAEARKLII